MPPLPGEAPRPLYEIIPEVKFTPAMASSEIYAPGHSYAIPSVNIAKPTEAATKTVDISKQTSETEKEDQKKKQEKKDKYKVKF